MIKSQVLKKNIEVRSISEEKNRLKIDATIFVSRESLLKDNFSLEEISDDWYSIIDPHGILNFNNSTVIIDYNHNQQNTGAKFEGFRKDFKDTEIKGKKYKLPTLDYTFIVDRTNESEGVNIFNLIKENRSFGISAGFLVKKWHFVDSKNNSIDNEAIKLYDGEKPSPKRILEIRKLLNKEVYVYIDSYYITSVSVLNNTDQGHYDAGINNVEMIRTSFFDASIQKSNNQNTINNLNNNMSKVNLTQPEEIKKEENRSEEEVVTPTLTDKIPEAPAKRSVEEYMEEMRGYMEEIRKMVTTIEERMEAKETAPAGETEPEEKDEEEKEMEDLEEVQRALNLKKEADKKKETRSKTNADNIRKTQTMVLGEDDKVQYSDEEIRQNISSQILKSKLNNIK